MTIGYPIYTDNNFKVILAVTKLSVNIGRAVLKHAVDLRVYVSVVSRRRLRRGECELIIPLSSILLGGVQFPFILTTSKIMSIVIIMTNLR